VDRVQWNSSCVSTPVPESSLVLRRRRLQHRVQVIGMMVGVYAYGYYLLARDPARYPLKR